MHYLSETWSEGNTLLGYLPKQPTWGQYLPKRRLGNYLEDGVHQVDPTFSEVKTVNSTCIHNRLNREAQLSMAMLRDPVGWSITPCQVDSPHRWSRPRLKACVLLVHSAQAPNVYRLDAPLVHGIIFHVGANHPITQVSQAVSGSKVMIGAKKTCKAVRSPTL